MRAGLHAIEAKRAVHVAGFSRLKELKLATALLVVALDAIMRLARGTNIRLPDPDLHGRHQRRDEIELPDRADVFAKTRVLEKSIHQHSAGKIKDDDPGRPPGTVPEIQHFIGPEEAGQQCDGEPFGAESARPLARGGKDFPAEIPRQRERADHAKQIAHRKKPDRADRAPVQPWHDPGEIHHAHLRTEQAVENHGQGDDSHEGLQDAPEIFPPHPFSKQRDPEEVEFFHAPGRLWFPDFRLKVPAAAGIQEADRDDRHGQKKNNRTRHPHQRSGSSLVIDRRQPRDPRRGGIGGINHTALERQECRQRGILQISEEQVGNHHPARQRGTRRPGLDHRPPE